MITIEVNEEMMDAFGWDDYQKHAHCFMAKRWEELINECCDTEKAEKLSNEVREGKHPHIQTLRDLGLEILKQCKRPELIH